LGVGVWGLGVWGMAPNPHPPIPNPQSPIPIIKNIFEKIDKIIFLFLKNNKIENENNI